MDGLLGGVAASLHPEPAQAVDALRGEPDVGHDRDAGGSERSDLVGHPLTAFELDGVGTGLLEEPGRRRERLRGAGFVTAEGQIGDHQRVRRAPNDAADQRDQLIDGDRNRGVVAVDHVGG